MNYLTKFTALILVILSFNTVETTAQRNVETIEIQTSALCATCEKIIMEALAFERGIRSAELDLETAILKIDYNSKRTDPETIRETISKAGYDADDVKADAKSYSNLPFCCRKESGVH